MTVANYIKQLLSFEEYSFSLSELRREIIRSEASIRGELSRLVNKKEVVNINAIFADDGSLRYISDGSLKDIAPNYRPSTFPLAKDAGFHGAAAMRKGKKRNPR